MPPTFSGSVSARVTGVNALTGNEIGSTTFTASVQRNYSPAAVVPDIVGGGGYEGTFTCPTTGGTLNLADSANICKTGAVGTIAPAQGYIITAVRKLKTLYLENTDGAATVDVTCPATLFLAGVGWVASQEVVKLQPYGAALFVFPAGSAVLTAGTNDALLFTASAGTPTIKIGAVFG
jgi:tartrate dehydratase beta subunit/fumarate hydratase class I family protein